MKLEKAQEIVDQIELLMTAVFATKSSVAWGNAENAAHNQKIVESIKIGLVNLLTNNK